MRTYKTSEEQIDSIVRGMDVFIDYVNRCFGDCFVYYQNIEEANERYKRNPETFFDDIRVDKKRFFEGWRNYKMLDIANKVKSDICDIHNTVIGMFINPDGDEYPIKVKDWLHQFEYFCYDNKGNLLSLEEQNNRLKNYPHFDASTKRPKTYNTQ